MSPATPATLCKTAGLRIFRFEFRPTVPLCLLSVQHAMLPAYDRSAEQVLELAHDYGAWFRELVTIKEGDDRADWVDHVAPLRSFGPASFAVADPLTLTNAIGCEIEDHGFGVNWEYDSPVWRAFVAKEMHGHAVLQS